MSITDLRFCRSTIFFFYVYIYVFFFNIGDAINTRLQFTGLLTFVALSLVTWRYVQFSGFLAKLSSFSFNSVTFLARSDPSCLNLKKDSAINWINHYPVPKQLVSLILDYPFKVINPADSTLQLLNNPELSITRRYGVIFCKSLNLVIVLGVSQ